MPPAGWSRSVPARRPAAFRRCATSPTCRTSCRSSTPRPEYVSTLATSTPISAHVPVDFELHGCPINKHQLLEVLSAFLNERRPAIPSYSVCVECKRRGNVCVMVAHGTPCLGPVTHAGLRRDLPVVPPRLLRLLRADGEPEHAIARRLAPTARRLATGTSFARSGRTTPAAEPFREQSDAHAER